ncbi:hypothetical protein V8E53_002398 [Lactarius tabidus]
MKLNDEIKYIHVRGKETRDCYEPGKQEAQETQLVLSKKKRCEGAPVLAEVEYDKGSVTGDGTFARKPYKGSPAVNVSGGTEQAGGVGAGVSGGASAPAHFLERVDLGGIGLYLDHINLSSPSVKLWGIHQEEELSSVEVMLLHGAARLLTAVKWIAEHPPLPEKWAYLNEKVNEEIIMIAEWKTATDSGWNPHWHIFTDTYIKQYCDQVTTENSTWNPDLYATDLSLYVAEMSARKQWWVLPGSTRPSAAQRSDDVTMADASSSGPPAPNPGVLTSTHTGKGKKCAVPPEVSPKENIQSNEEHTQKKATEMLPGVPVPSMHVEGASPPWPKAPAPPIATDAGSARKLISQHTRLNMGALDVSGPPASYVMVARGLAIGQGPHGQYPYSMPCMKFVPSPVGQGLNEDTHCQLNRIKAMLTGICGSKGIVPENLPGYECCRLASPSLLTLSSPGMHMEMLNISDTHSNTSAQSSMSSEPPCKAGEVAPLSETKPVVAQAPPICVTHHWEGFKADKFFFLR